VFSRAARSTEPFTTTIEALISAIDHAVPVGSELGELVHGGSSPLPAVAGLPCSTVTGRFGRSPYVARTGEAQD
jgi:hypothetical protein